MELKVSQSLYALSSDLKQILDDLSENGGEFTDQAERAMLTATGMIKDKTDACVSWVQSQEDLIDLVDKRISDLEDMKKRISNRLKKFDDYSLSCLRLLGTNKIEGAMFAIKMRKPSTVTIIENEKLIPMDFIKIPEAKPQLMIAEIGKALKAGTPVPGARLGESSNITINYGTK